MRYCTKCGAPNNDQAQFCTNCQAILAPIANYQPPLQTVNNQGSLVNWESMGADKKIPAGICAILLGGFGVHKFIMGYTTEGIIQLVLGLCGIGWIIGLVEGIIYLTKSDEDYVRTYFQNRRGWF
ncbi:MAG TPA: TM2 domain-containing protein [Pyrinomonadaceae bacterium]|nr:TM2 domain-containing protein [Pyrinomonadaceae bacterium]